MRGFIWKSFFIFAFVFLAFLLILLFLLTLFLFGLLLWLFLFLITLGFLCLGFFFLVFFLFLFSSLTLLVLFSYIVLLSPFLQLLFIDFKLGIHFFSKLLFLFVCYIFPHFIHLIFFVLRIIFQLGILSAAESEVYIEWPFWLVLFGLFRDCHLFIWIKIMINKTYLYSF